MSEYFDDALVDLLARSYAGMQHPDGTQFVFPTHATEFLGHTEEEQAANQAMNQGIAEAQLNYLQTNGYSIIPTAQLAQPQQFGEHTIVYGVCATCANKVIPGAILSQAGGFTMPSRTICTHCHPGAA